VLGILIAAAVSVAASRLASQQIGLDSEPISAGDALVPGSGAKEPAQHSPSNVLSGEERTRPQTPPPGPPADPELSQPVAPTSREAPPSEHADDAEGAGGGEHSAGADD
jgi:hypothetical protein